MKGVHLERNKPLQAPEAACSMTAPAVAAPLASGFAAHSGLAQMFTPPPDRGRYGLNLGINPWNLPEPGMESSGP